jgi:hypothetical protein
VLDLHDDEAQDGGCEVPATVLAGVRVVQVGAEEGCQVRAGLGDDEVVYVEELGDAMEGGVAVGIGGRGWVGPGAEGGFFGAGPAGDGAVFVFAEEGDGTVKGGVGGIRCEGRGPD